MPPNGSSEVTFSNVPVAVVPEQRVAPLAVEPRGHGQVQVAVEVVVAEAGPGAGGLLEAGSGHPRAGGDVGERAVAVVAVEEVVAGHGKALVYRAIADDEDIEPAVAVHVAHRGAVAVMAGRNSGLGGAIGERAVAVVHVQPVGLGAARRHEQVLPTVPVEVADGAARTGHRVPMDGGRVRPTESALLRAQRRLTGARGQHDGVGHGADVAGGVRSRTTVESQRRPLRPQQRPHQQHRATPEYGDGPGAARVDGDAAATEGLGKREEGNRPGGGGGEQQGRGRRRTGAEDQQQRDERDLEQQRHVDQNTERRRNDHPQQAVAEVGGNGLRLQRLDGRAAGEAGHDHERQHAPHQAGERAQPCRAAGAQHLRPGRRLRCHGRHLTGELGARAVVEARAAPPHRPRDQGPQRERCDQPENEPACTEQRGEHHRDHQQRRHVQRGRSVHQGERALDSHAAAPQRAGHRSDTGGTEVEHGAETDALQDAPPTPASTVEGRRACTHRHVGDEKRLGNGRGRKREQHPDGNELQVGHGESPPTSEEPTPFPRPVGVLDAEPLKTLRGGGERGAQVLAHRIQLGQPVQRRERHQDDEQQRDARDAALGGGAGEQRTRPDRRSLHHRSIVARNPAGQRSCPSGPAA